MREKGPRIEENSEKKNDRLGRRENLIYEKIINKIINFFKTFYWYEQ
jgi:hypothetical protein